MLINFALNQPPEDYSKEIYFAFLQIKIGAWRDWRSGPTAPRLIMMSVPLAGKPKRARSLIGLPFPFFRINQTRSIMISFSIDARFGRSPRRLSMIRFRSRSFLLLQYLILCLTRRPLTQPSRYSRVGGSLHGPFPPLRLFA